MPSGSVSCMQNVFGLFWTNYWTKVISSIFAIMKYFNVEESKDELLIVYKNY